MASTMNIVLYCPARLPVREYGGTERVVVWLARGLAERGHRVTVIALPGTKLPSATVIPIPNKLALQDGGPDLTPLLP
ncbi:MAG: glycosyltransferase, partial [Gemmatimonadales bacterium]|nr:glycosyltransferase [Gemmatimonadales bacterium]MBP6570520.1 glycosyltransferase [Gemmatimonadales bacterium]